MKRTFKQKNISELLVIIAIIIVVNFIAQISYTRIDLTTDKRFSLNEISKKTVSELENSVYIQVYLTGDLPLGFSKFSTSITEILDELKIYGKRNIQFDFIDPYSFENEEDRNILFNELSEMGIDPVNIRLKEDGGNFSEKIVFPAAVINYMNKKTAVNLLRNNPSLSAEQNLNFSVESLEYEFINGIRNLTKTDFPFIAFIEGHDELNEYETEDITRALSEFYNIDRVRINGQLDILDPYSAIVIAKPKEKFSEKDKFVIDQYIMRGGRVLWLIDRVHASMDSLSKGNTTMGLAYDLNLDDQLFKYGIRINPNFIQDVQSVSVPVNMALVGQSPKWVPAPWIYSPLITPGSANSITKGLNMIKAEFVNKIDVLENTENNLQSTVLLHSSEFSKTVESPMVISLGDIHSFPDQSEFTEKYIPIAVLQEGKFESVFKNRLVKDYIKNSQKEFKEQSEKTSMIVISDGDMIRNDYFVQSGGIMIRPLGYDRYMNQTFGNKLFIKNCIDYLCDETEIINLRSREFKIRALDKNKIRLKRLNIQLINVVLPSLIVILIGLVYILLHRRKYSKK